MLNFDLNIPTRIVFGKDSHKEIGPLLRPYASKILLHYGGGSIKKSGVYGAVATSLKGAGLPFVELGGVVPNQRVELVRDGIALCKAEGVDLILAIGGGSVIDSAKAIAIGFYYSGDIWDIYRDQSPIQNALPVATVLTIPAAGSESSDSSVISNQEEQRKLGYSNRLIRPLLSVLNPELFFTLPRNQIANGVADMTSHIFERYFTNTKHCDLTDSLCEATLRTILKHAPKVAENPRDYAAWCEIGFGGALAHNGLLGMGREQDWACHKMEHELSAVYDIPHGAGLAVLTPHWMRYVYQDNIGMFLQFAVKVMGVEGGYRDPDTIIVEAIDRLSGFYQSLGLPSTLSELGIGAKSLETMAKRATGEAFGLPRFIGGVKKLSSNDVLTIYQSAL